MNTKEIENKQTPFTYAAIIALVITFFTYAFTFPEPLETINVIINTIAFIALAITAWISCFYFGKREALGDKVVFHALFFILIGGIIPSVIVFLIGKYTTKK